MRSLLKIEPECSKCHKSIEANELIYVKMRYPSYRGMSEIKSFIQNDGKIICENCYEKVDND